MSEGWDQEGMLVPCQILVFNGWLKGKTGYAFVPCIPCNRCH